MPKPTLLWILPAWTHGCRPPVTILEDVEWIDWGLVETKPAKATRPVRQRRK